jgi:hypothetical protein
MNFMRESLSAISPTRTISRATSQELAFGEVVEKLREERVIWDLMEHVGTLFHKHMDIISEIGNNRIKIQEEAMDGSGTWQIKKECEAAIVILEEQEKSVCSEIAEYEDRINMIYEEIGKDEDLEIKDFVQKRRNTLERFETHSCSIAGYQSRYNQKPFCSKMDEDVQKIEGEILARHTEYYWTTHSLANFKSTKEFPHPGYYQPNGSYVDVKAIVDGSKHIAIIENNLRPATEQLIAGANLSRAEIMLPKGGYVIYDKDSVEKALEIAHLIESKQFNQKNASSVYNYHLKLGTLLEYEKSSVQDYALRKARRIDPSFQAIHSN